MKLRKTLLAAALLSAVAVSGTSMAARGGWGGHGGGHGGWHGGGWHGGYGVGALIGGTILAGALLSPWAYGSPYYYSSYPTVVEYAPAAPTVYYEQPRVYYDQPRAYAEPQPMEAPRATQPAAADSGSWYYCNDSRAYYPYVRDCASPWQRVAPTPSPR
ncbi:MAG: hypothetical protein ABI854_05535 [Betaproteobacteria bacterium]